MARHWIGCLLSANGASMGGMSAPALFDDIRNQPPCVDAAAGRRGLDALPEATRAACEPVADFLTAIFAAAPYLARLAARRPDLLAACADQPPSRLRDRILDTVRRAGGEAADAAALDIALREAKADMHLLAALADLGGVWTLQEMTGALSALADAALCAALHGHARFEAARGRIAPPADPDNPVPGLFILALGKMGARELNYSSDIDLAAFYDPARLDLPEDQDPHKRLPRLIQSVCASLQNTTGEGYVFRVDLRLRPDPGATPVAMSTGAALNYYEAMGQTWERAAWIKARASAGDRAAAEDFLDHMQPFIWRRALDFAAVDDIRGLAKQIQTVGRRAEMTAAGHDLKLGRGGIREIEFYAQVPQLVFGGREPSVRTPATLDALAALTVHEAIDEAARAELSGDYETLRAWEHRIQMRQDEPTQSLPQDDAERRAVAALAGFADLAAFDEAVVDILKRVHIRFSEQFHDEETLASSAGSLVLTGVEPTRDTLATLEKLGFKDAERTWKRLSGWASGRAKAARTARARSLLTRLAPRLVDIMAETGEPDAAFTRFAAFYESLPLGVQPLSLLINEPGLASDLIDVLTLAPRMAEDLARRPDLIDVMLDRRFSMPVAEDREQEFAARLEEAVAEEEGFEGALNAARRLVREEKFRIGVQVLRGALNAQAAGAAYAAVAEAVLKEMASAAEMETETRFGPAPGAWCVLGLGKFGGREMSADSDLDLMIVYEPDVETAPEAAAWYSRFAQRLVSALSAPTEEGGLYEVDMQLRPSGRSGPVAVQLKRFTRYYLADAWTWELMALTRARAVAGDPRFCDLVGAAADAALAHARPREMVLEDAVDMRRRLLQQTPAKSAWDLKRRPGGLVEIEFIAQALQVAHAREADIVRASTSDAFRALAAAGLLPEEEARFLSESGDLIRALYHLIRTAHGAGFDPAEASRGFSAALARAGGAESAEALADALDERCARVRMIFEARLGGVEKNRG